jgi:hypothetical protein
MTIYAKVRKQKNLDHYGKNVFQYRLEVRDIAPETEIKSEILDERFDSKAQAETFAISKGYSLTSTWYRAENKELLYRDGSQNMYRLKSEKFGATDPSDPHIKAANEAWYKMFPPESQES